MKVAVQGNKLETFCNDFYDIRYEGSDARSRGYKCTFTREPYIDIESYNNSDVFVKRDGLFINASQDSQYIFDPATVMQEKGIITEGKTTTLLSGKTIQEKMFFILNVKDIHLINITDGREQSIQGIGRYGYALVQGQYIYRLFSVKDYMVAHENTENVQDVFSIKLDTVTPFDITLLAPHKFTSYLVTI